MSNVKPLHPGYAIPSREPNAALVEALEAILDAAKSGELQSFIGTGWRADGLRHTLWCDFHTNIYEMAGSLSWLHAEYLHRHTEAE